MEYQIIYKTVTINRKDPIEKQISDLSNGMGISKKEAETHLFNNTLHEHVGNQIEQKEQSIEDKKAEFQKLALELYPDIYHLYEGDLVMTVASGMLKIENQCKKQ